MDSLGGTWAAWTIRVVPCGRVEPKVHLCRLVPGPSMTGTGDAMARAARADAVEREVNVRITPSSDYLERVALVRAELVKRVTDVARERSSSLVRALVAGSAARGTFLQ